MEKKWVKSIHRQCRAFDIAFFFKQWGGVRKHTTGRELYGRTYDELPSYRESEEMIVPLELVMA